jgi:thymidylate synthase
MKQTVNLIKDVLANGNNRGDRTGTGTVSLFSKNLCFDLTKGFPLVTTRKINIKPVIAELLWFLEGSTNTKRLKELGASFWDQWADEQGELGPVYGAQWRQWKGVNSTGEVVVIDQIKELINGLKTKPFSRRHIVSAWNVADLPDESLSPQENVKLGKMALAPCHYQFQMYVEKMSLYQRVMYARDVLPDLFDMRNISVSELAKLPDFEKVPEHRLSCLLNIRSNDLPVGNPFNVAEYALLLMMVAQCTGMAYHQLHVQIGDAHVYADQVEGAMAQIDRPCHALPRMKINPLKKDIFSFEMSDFELTGYESGPHIAYPVAV